MEVSKTSTRGDADQYAVGDVVYVHISEGSGKLREATVVHTFTLPSWPMRQYVVEIPTSVDPILSIRDWWAISPTPDGPIALYRRPHSVTEIEKVAKNP